MFTELDESRRLVADIRVQFNKASDASNRSVMAETDEASIAFARDADANKRVLQTEVAVLAPLLHRVVLPDEIRLLDEFGKHFAEYQKLDSTILELAVENTNLKAQRLSFGPAREAADRFRDALATIPPAVASKDRWRAEALVGKAVLAVREIQVVMAPHIAEADDAAMARMEKEMADLETVARDALKVLSGIDAQKTRASLAAASTSLDAFKGISSQLVKLSRRNSNVRSLNLSLREKPPLIAACDDSLRALQDALAKEGFKATR